MSDTPFCGPVLLVSMRTVTDTDAAVTNDVTPEHCCPKLDSGHKSELWQTLLDKSDAPLTLSSIDPAQRGGGKGL